MKGRTIFLCGLALAGCFCAAEEVDPFAPQQPAPKPEISKRGVGKLPSAIAYEVLNDGRHQYTISGLYELGEEDKPGEVASRCASDIQYLEVRDHGTVTRMVLKPKTKRVSGDE